MITSEYLEMAVDFDKPILAVGPGLQSLSTNQGYLSVPLDVAVIWFAERLCQRQGRLDIFDIPPQIETPWSFHGIDKVQRYMDGLAARAPLGEIRYIEGDIAHHRFPENEYGTIWDHGTLEGLIYSSRPLPGSREKGDIRRVKKIMNTYQQALSIGGKLIFAGEFYEDRVPFQAERAETEGFMLSKLELEKDAYETSLTLQELFPLKNTTAPCFWNNGQLLPRYDTWKSILEMIRIG